MALLSTSSRLIKVGQDYSAGSGISINDHVISVTGEFGKVYSAGENISIDGNVINSKDWTNDIANASANAYNQATAQIPEPFDPTYLSGEIDNKLNSTAFTSWQNGQYSTDLQTIEGQISNKLDKSAFSDVSASFLTAINIPESATWNEVSQAYEQASGTYLTAHQSLSNYYTKDETSGKEQLAQAFANIPAGDTEVNAYVHNNSASIDGTSTVVQSNSSTWSDITAYQSNSASYLTAINIPGSATWNDTSDVVQSNSAQWAEGGTGGDEEVNELVHTNSATWNSVTAKQDSLTFGHGTTSGSVSSINGSAIIDDYTYHMLNVTRVATANLNKAITANSGTWNTVTDKLDTTAQVVTGYTTATIEGTNVVNSLNSKALIAFRAASAQQAGVANNARYDDEGNNLADDHNSFLKGLCTK